MAKVYVTKRKGRVGGALIGTLLFPGLGTLLGAAIGTRSETREHDEVPTEKKPDPWWLQACLAALSLIATLAIVLWLAGAFS